MSSQPFETYPYTVDLNDLALRYEKDRYAAFLEAGDFHSIALTVDPDQPRQLSLGYVAAGWMQPGSDAMRMKPCGEVL